MLYLDKQVRANALCTSQTRKIELTEQTMVSVLSNGGIDAREKEGSSQPYPEFMESVHQDDGTFEDIWPLPQRAPPCTGTSVNWWRYTVDILPSRIGINMDRDANLRSRLHDQSSLV